MATRPDFTTWRHTTLVWYAQEAYDKINQLNEKLAFLEKDNQELLNAYHRLVVEIDDGTRSKD